MQTSAKIISAMWNANGLVQDLKLPYPFPLTIIVTPQVSTLRYYWSPQYMSREEIKRKKVYEEKKVLFCFIYLTVYQLFMAYLIVKFD